MNTYEIYLITNKINNKKYIGQVKETKGYLRRFEEHCKESLNPSSFCSLHCAISKYGRDNFKIELIENNIPNDLIDERERFYIEKFNSYYKNRQGYNMTLGGRGCDGYEHTKETRDKISNSSKRNWIKLKEDEIRYKQLCEKHSLRTKGIPKSIEHRKKLSQIASTKVGNKNAFYGKHHNEKTKKIISENNSKKVGAFDINTNELLFTFKSLKEATNFVIREGKTMNKNASARISKICRGVDKSAYGYVWRFID